MATDVVKQGYVRLQTKKLGIWNKKWLMLRRASGKGPLRLERYKDEAKASVKSVYGADKKIIDLTKIDEAQRLPENVKKHGVTLLTGSSNLLQFCVHSEMEAESWLFAIRDEMHPENRITHESFSVYMMPNDYFSTPGDCVLQLERDSIRIMERYGRRELITWPYAGLRRYGLESNMFSIEAGSSCPLGEGHFYFRCDDSEFIYHRVQTLAQAMHRTNGRSSTQLQPSFSEANWGNAPSIRELSERRADRTAAENEENANHYRLDESMPERPSTKRTGPLPPTPGSPTSVYGAPYLQVPVNTRGSNATPGVSASFVNRAGSIPSSSPGRIEGATGSPYYAVPRGTHDTPTHPHQSTNGTFRPSTTSASGSTRSGAITSGQPAAVGSSGSPYYSVSRRGEADDGPRQSSAARGSDRERSRRMDGPADDLDFYDPTNGPMRSVRVDGTYYAVGRTGRPNQMTSSSSSASPSNGDGIYHFPPSSGADQRSIRR